MITRNVSGGKGNFGMFIERDTKICAAGLPTAQPEQSVNDNFSNYSLQDTVEALIGDSVKSLPETVHKSQVRRNNTRDMRNAGIFSEGSELINPPVKTKYQSLADDLKETAFNSYWNKGIGKAPDPVPSLPQGFKIYNTTAGKKTHISKNLYEVIMPVNAFQDKPPVAKEPGYQTNRNYQSFNSNSIFGKKSFSDKSGKLVRNCLTNNNILIGTALKVPVNNVQASFQNSTTCMLAEALAPNNNIQNVPKGFTFGKLISSDDNLPEFLRTCEKNSYKELLNKCLEHLNTLRNSLAKRFDGPFFKTFYLNLKFLDNTKSGWLEKYLIYKQCNMIYIRFNPSLIEPLLHVWNAFNGSNIEYKIFVRVINYREPFPEIPKIDDESKRFLNFQTTYSEMTNNKQYLDKNNRAGIPSGRYFEKDYPMTPNGFCMADRYYFPEETDMKACLNPSIFTLLGISHRDMYANRDPATIKKIFENAGERFHDQKFKDIWEIAEKHHSQKWVCLETFRRALIEYEMKGN